MSFNGSGTFLINSTGQPVVANTVISATVFNALTADLASGLTNCITKDGQSTPTANIPMGSNKITGLANGTLINDAATLGQVQTTAAKLITSVSGADTVTGIMSPTLTAYAAGQLFYFVAVGANTGAVTLNIDGLGAKAVTRDGSTALAAGDINSGEMVVVIYDGTRFQMINAANSFGNTTINGTLTVTGNTGLQANVSITSTLSVGGTFAVTGAATLGSTLAVTGKSDLPTVSTASINAAVAVVTTGTVTNLTATSASVASVNAGVALLTTATVTDLTASSASIASANIGNLQFTAASIASINAGVAVVTNLTATSASIASANVGTAVVTTGTVTNLTSTSASIASANAAVALVTTGTVTNLTSTAASIASANLGTAVVTTGTVTNLTATSASIASANAGTAVVTNLTATGASIASANVGTGVVTALTVTGASIASANVGTGVITTLTATGASVASINAGVALVTTGTVTNLTSTAASIASANIGVAAIGTLSFTGASIASLNAGTATITSGNLTFSSTGQRITGDMSNATVTSRVALQTSTANSNTILTVLPTGTGSGTFTEYYQSGTDPANSSVLSVGLAGGAGVTRINSTITGTGTYLPLTFNTGGSERMRLTTDGNLGLGTASPSGSFQILRSSDPQFILTDDGTSSFSFGTTTGYSVIGTDAAAINFKTGVSTGSVFTTGDTRMTIDSSGNVGIGGTASAFAKVHALGTLPSSSNASQGFRMSGEIPSTSTTSARSYFSFPSTQAASFTLDSLYHFDAFQGTFGAGSTVTNQVGFRVSNTLTGATNNYGFYSDIASGTNRWNFYAAGTADNYFAGSTGVGIATPTFKFEVQQGSSGATPSLRQTPQIVLKGYGGSSSYHSGIGFSMFEHTNGYWGSGILEIDDSGSYGAAMAFYTSTGSATPTPSERMRIDSSGNVGIGTASPASKLDINTGGSAGTSDLITLSGLDSGSAKQTYATIRMGIENNTAGAESGNLHLQTVESGTVRDRIYINGTGYMTFLNGGTERMRITSGGEVYIAGTTDQGAYNLQCNGTGVWGAGAYVNGSDARLKDNIQSLDSGLDVVKAMRPVTFQYKPEYSKDQSVQPGFIAQELQDAMAGKPYLEGVVQEGTNHLNVAYQNIIPILVKAIQELEAKVAALEAK